MRRIAIWLTTLIVALTTSGLSAPAHGATYYSKAPVPTVVGRLISGETLTANENTWVPAPQSFSYTWKLSTGQIIGSDNSLIVPSNYEGKKITLTVVAHAVTPGVSDVSRVSAQYAIGQPFTQTAGYSIASSPHLGEWLYPICEACWSIDSSGEYVDGQNLSDSFEPVPTVRKGQWYRDGVAIKGATSAGRQVTYDDLGHNLQVVITFSSPGYEVLTLPSNVTDPVVARQFTATVRPSINNTSPKFGDVLTASVGDWDPVVDDSELQWYRNDSPISKANGWTYKVGAADMGAAITFGYKGYLENYETLETFSEPTSTVLAGDIVSPGDVTVVGSQTVGSTLSIVVGKFPSGVRLSYQWFDSSGSEIQNATKSTYKISASDTDQQLTVRVTATKAGYNDLVIASSPTDPVSQRAFSSKPTPKIVGKLCMDCTLTAKITGWNPEPEFSFQWLRDGLPIIGATQDDYILSDADGGHKISFIQIARDPNSEVGTVVGFSNTLSNWVVKTGKYTISGEDFVDECGDTEGNNCYYDDCECGWGFIDSGDFDSSVDYFYRSFTFDLGRTPISWSASFTGDPKSISKWRGAYVEDGSFWYYAEGPNDAYGSQTNFKRKNNKNIVSAKSTLHDGSIVGFGLGSYDIFATINFRYFIITYTYYQ